MFIHPFRETRYGTVALSQKGILAFKVSSHKVQSVWQQLQSTYLFQGSMYLLCICPSPHNYIRFRSHMKTNCNNPSSDTKQLNNCCDTKQLLKFQERGKHKNTLTTKVSCLVSRSDQNSFHFLHSSGRFQWLNILHSNTFTTATQNNIRGYLMHLRNPTNVPKKVVSTCHLSQSVVNQQSQHQVPPCLQCHDGSYFSLSLSQHSSAYPSRPTVPAHYRTSGVQLLTSYLTHVAIQFFREPRSLTKQIWPSRLSCHSFSFLLPPPGMTPGSVAPRTIHSVSPGSTTTWPTCRDVTLSYSTFLVWTYAAPLPSSPFRSSSFRCFLVILQALSLSLPKSPSFLVTLQAKVTTTLSLSSDSPGSLCQSHHPFLSSDSPGSRCQSHYNTLHNYKSHIQRNCKPSHMQFSRWHLFSTLTTFVRDSIAYTYHMSHTALNTKVF